MKVRHLITLTLLLLSLGFSSYGQETYTYGNRQDSSQRRLFPSQRDKRHGRENMQAIIDSLQRVIDALQNELNQRDSIENDMLNLIQEEEAALPEDNYTVEKTDSLLNMWYLQNQISRQAEYESFNDLEDIGEFNSDSVRSPPTYPTPCW